MGISNNTKDQILFKNDRPEKPLRYSQDSLTKVLIGKAVKITLLNNQTLTGRLKDVGVYDISVEVNKTVEMEISGKKITKDRTVTVIMQKGALATVEVTPP